MGEFGDHRDGLAEPDHPAHGLYSRFLKRLDLVRCLGADLLDSGHGGVVVQERRLEFALAPDLRSSAADRTYVSSADSRRSYAR